MNRDLLDMRRCQGVAIVNPGQFLFALELYTVDADAIADRFGQKTLKEIQETVPLEPETAARVKNAMAVSEGA
ncbi:MAG: hypothetical protein PVG71_02405 [Anaerolineae bacterium]